MHFPLSKSTLLDQPNKIHINDQVFIALLAIYGFVISQAMMLINTVTASPQATRVTAGDLPGYPPVEPLQVNMFPVRTYGELWSRGFQKGEER